jgi:Transglycosylase-like domain
MRTRIRTLSRLTVFVLAFSALAGEAPAATTEPSAAVMEKIRKARADTWRWQRLMGVRLTRTNRAAERTTSLEYRRTILRSWREVAAKARRRANHPRRLRAWLCIHRHEGPWNANTGNGYYGGLQMDRTFQRQYAPVFLRRKGLAHRWKPIEQIWVAERAYRSGRGYYPWPNAARACGLI